jgi:nitroimidazol reductase NimA-like FMN-containing flavoprotein (pyridoxamine 5'-phosphate oxidase superfamily)
MKYHMNRKEKEIKDPGELRSILKRGKYTTLSLCRQNEPYVVTMNYGYDEEKNTLYFHCAQNGLKLNFIRTNPQVCGTVIEDHGYLEGQCDHAYRTVVFWGKIHIVDDPKGKNHALLMLLNHLEKDPEPIRKRTFSDDKALKRVGILRLNIEDITGKQGNMLPI